MVMVSHAHRFIFLKTRKTAGTSIEMLLEPLCAPANHTVVERTKAIISDAGIVGSRLVSKKQDHETGDWFAHCPADDVRSGLGWRKWMRNRRISAVRNPFDRAVSLFYWRAQSRKIDLPEDFAGQRAAFRADVLGKKMPNDFEIVHQNGKFCVHHILRYEHLGEDLAMLVEKLKLPINPNNLPRVKASTSRPRNEPIAAYFDADTIRAVQQQQAWVFKNFNYSPMPPDRDVD